LSCLGLDERGWFSRSVSVPRSVCDSPSFSYISLKLENHENDFYHNFTHAHHHIPMGPSPAGYSISGGDAQCGWNGDGEQRREFNLYDP
jgi:hypothetical protein